MRRTKHSKPNHGLQRLDGAAAVSAHIAPSKARSAALGRRDTKGYEDMINNGPQQHSFGGLAT